VKNNKVKRFSEKNQAFFEILVPANRNKPVLNAIVGNG
jgi:hypothetical protein